MLLEQSQLTARFPRDLSSQLDQISQVCPIGIPSLVFQIRCVVKRTHCLKSSAAFV